MSTSMSTSDTIKEYLGTLTEEKLDVVKSSFPLEVIESYEKKNRKRLWEMSPESLMGLFFEFDEGRRNIPKSTATLESYVSRYREFFEWYSRNVRVILNPLNDPKVKPKWVLQQVLERFGGYDLDYMDNLVRAIRDGIEPEIYSKYLELIARLLYNNFKPAEIVLLKKEDIDANNYASVGGRRIFVMEETRALLEKFDSMSFLPSESRHKEYFLRWRGSYLRHIVRPRGNEDAPLSVIQEEFNNRSLKRMGQKVSNLVSTRIQVKAGFPVSARILQKVGYRDFIVKKVGKEHANELLLSDRNRQFDAELVALARELGDLTTATNIRKKLKQYIVYQHQHDY